MRRWIAIAAGLAILAAANVSIHRREQLITMGRVVLLELAPVDPRSLMQGDYMALRFKAADDAFGRVPERQSGDGRVVLKLDPRDVGSFARLDHGAGLAANEVRMRYRIRHGVPKFGTNAYFFQEGRAQRYAAARFGEFRVAPDGEAILTQLRDGELRVLR
jgi:uncharacterized membrane-anchored protein